ncbi:YncE family protein [Caldicellulosiruptor morganii]|uniref:NHL repeat containing protein n=1 Tax=Caldicellulosiruptor morganii TaxID=1387555 RepID=A0ABY7BNS3_9FIRM|nr:hypothetical protein [Caldicellulosiruptor morganii]WAM33186.1 hypothetical protein OTK00_001662 [Caldicellulosiruptor morganii]
MKNIKRTLALLMIFILVVVSAFSVLSQKTTASIISDSKSSDFPNFKTVLKIPVSEEGIEYTGMVGYGSHEGPNAFDVKGDKIYILDNVHHRVLVYTKIKGNLIEKISIPEEQWIHGMAVDKNGKIYLYNAGTNTLITINNRVVDIAKNQELRLEPFYKFDLNDKGPFVVLSGEEKMTTCFLAKNANTNKLFVVEKRDGVFSADGSVSEVKASACKASVGGSETFEFPGWFVDKYSAYDYIGKRGFIQFWKITNDYGEWIVKLNSKTRNIEGLVKIPDCKYSFPVRDVILEGNDVFVLLPCEKDVYVLKVDSWITGEQYAKYIQSERMEDSKNN